MEGPHTNLRFPEEETESWASHSSSWPLSSGSILHQLRAGGICPQSQDPEGKDHSVPAMTVMRTRGR